MTGSANRRPSRDPDDIRTPEVLAGEMLRRIVNGLHAPGSRLTERQIAEACGCSHGYAREVIYRLEKAGAVVVSQRRGATVVGLADAPPDQSEPIWRTLLNLLERLAQSRLVADGGTGAPYDQLVRIHDDLERMGRAAHDPRLAELLRRISLQRMIVEGAPQ